MNTNHYNNSIVFHTNYIEPSKCHNTSMMTILILNSYNITTYLSLKSTYWEYLNYLKIKSVENITPYVIVREIYKCTIKYFN
ncbi:hypothetical protein PFMALIP_00769 [Plasmodium falciparum MaliPS096_E11]|uniref:Uncharacterized protein n=1 Tax=Plasmodium falciparum MaliPS096_E11 TaxID=1036727 RepID=A0A024WVC7_PLAFA|nr:hypothetical protein PFMALIP_00769 [Plasmodium falciparum MaliPS096_E11]